MLGLGDFGNNEGLFRGDPVFPSCQQWKEQCFDHNKKPLGGVRISLTQMQKWSSVLVAFEPREKITAGYSWHAKLWEILPLGWGVDQLVLQMGGPEILSQNDGFLGN